MTDKDERKKATKTAIDAFIVVERIYRHSYQVLVSLKDELKKELNLKESASYGSYTSATDPKSWIWQFRGLYLSPQKISLEEYQKKEIPILLLQISMYNSNGREPIFRYGIIKKIFNFIAWKGIRFDDYFKMALNQMHDEQKSGNIKMTHCEATVDFKEIALLDIREDKDVSALAKEITEKHMKHFHY